MSDSTVPLLRSLTEAHAVPGFEHEVRDLFVEELSGCGSLHGDAQGSVYCDLPGEGPKVLVAGHMDEVGFRIQNILPDGFLQFVPLGGWWEHALLSQPVTVKTREGRKIPGVIASKPPHFLGPEERGRVLPITSMVIDVGASSRSEVKKDLGIRLGDPVAPLSSFRELAVPDRYMAKAFDNRVGMAGAIQVGQWIGKRGSVNQVTVAGTVQEEMGLRGAHTLLGKVRPDVAILLEGPPADDTYGFSPGEMQGILGGGVQIRLHDKSALLSPRFTDLAIELAEEKRIPHQVAVRRSGGTDAGAVQQAHGGIPCVVLGTPARYIHSHHAIVDLHDYRAMVTLACELLSQLGEAKVASLRNYV
ncbi:MAG: M20/M25/M40 family metallo-hydrolase [Verrucomicrobiota bacterium]